jgi:hypothetical protein
MWAPGFQQVVPPRVLANAMLTWYAQGEARKHSQAFPHNPVYNRGKARFLVP